MPDARLLTFVEIDVDRCSNIYSVLPCLASSGDKCFNSLRTCQSVPQLTPETVTLRYAVPTDYLPIDIDCIPNIISLSFTPGTVSPGQSLGQRATMTIAFKDHPDSDAGPGGDRYVSDRSYNPYKRGTYWGKFRARYPYLQGRPLRVIRGLLGQSLDQMDVRHYIINSFDGPKPDGTFSIIAKDVLKLADDDKSQAPLVSEGFLLADITATQTSITLGPTGVGALYPGSGSLNIGGSEIVTFTRSGDNFTIVRGQNGTTGQTHKAQDRCQLCLIYTEQSPAEIISDLLTTYAGISSDFIPLDDWKTEVFTILDQVYSATIAEPVGVNALISELVQQAALSIWWDDASQTIKLQVLRTISPSAELINEGTIEAGTMAVAEQPDLRVSQVWTYYGLINPLVNLTETSNYRSVELLVNGQLQSDYGAPAIKQIFSRWIPQSSRSIATKLNQLIMGQYQDPPRKFTFSLFGQSADVKLGSGYNLQFRTVQDASGLPTTVPIQITRLDPSPDHYKIEAQEALFTPVTEEDANTRTIVIDTNTQNFNLKTVHDSLFPSFTDPTGITIVCVIPSSVIVFGDQSSIASLTTRDVAFEVGDFPDGTDITILLNGAIVGGGGRGGLSSMSADGPTTSGNGQVGGTALRTTLPIKIASPTTSKKIWGGGGGGAGTGLVSDALIWAAGGGAGAGEANGLGGHASGGVGPPTKPGNTEGLNSTALAAGGDIGFVIKAGIEIHSGAGGSPGNAGSDSASVAATGSTAYNYTGGAAGRSIDGISLVTFTDETPQLLGPSVN